MLFLLSTQKCDLFKIPFSGYSHKKLDAKKMKFGRQLWFHDRILISCWVLSFRVQQQPIRHATRISVMLRNQYGISDPVSHASTVGKRIKRVKRKVFAKLFFVLIVTQIWPQYWKHNMFTLQSGLLRKRAFSLYSPVQQNISELESESAQP